MSGMIGKRKETVSNKAFIVNLKKVGGWKMKGAPFMYFSLRQNDRKFAPTSVELNNRERFKLAVIATRERLMDPNYIDVDQQGFLKQTKYPTIYGYVFRICYDDLA